MRLFVAVVLFLPLACPAIAQQRPVVNLLATSPVIETRPLPPPAATGPDFVVEEADAVDVDEGRAADLRRQQVAYTGSEAPGTIIVDTARTHLFLVMEGGQAMRYGIGVGREGFTWSGRERVSRMAEWPDWYPPKEMIERQPYLPRVMAGGEGNPLGARAMYLGNTLYRIHGTNQPQTIGKYVSSGCIRLTNEDIEDLYGRVKVGAEVVVLQADGSAPPAPAVASSAKSSTAAAVRLSAPVLSNRSVEPAAQNTVPLAGSVIPLPRRKPAMLVGMAKSDRPAGETNRKVIPGTVRAKAATKLVKVGQPVQKGRAAVKREKGAANAEAKAEDGGSKK